MTNFPSQLPVGCPPPTAVPASGVFHRLVKSIPVSQSDFHSYLEMHRVGRKKRTWTDDCDAAAVSLLGNIADVQVLLASMAPPRNKVIATGSITGAGKMLQDPSTSHPSHHKWWRPLDDVAWSTFR